MPETAKFHLDWWLTAAEKCPVAVAFINVDGRYAWTNPAFSKLLGWSKAEIVGKHWTDITPLTEIGEGQQTELRGRLGEQLEVFETKHLKTKAGAESLVSIYAHRFPPYGEYQGWIMFITDAGATRESVDQLRQEYVRIKGMVDGISAARDRDQEERRTALREVIEEQRATKERIDELMNSLLTSNGNNKSSVSIGGDYAGRDKTNTPTTVLIWMIIAVMALGLAAMGAKLIMGHNENNRPQITVEP